MCHNKFLHLLVLHFPPLFVTISPSGGETDWLQTVVAVSGYSVPGRNNVAAGVGMVDAVGVVLQTIVSVVS